MRVIMLAAAAAMLASCTTGQMAATNTGATPQEASTANQRDTPIPPAFRAPRQQSGTGWPDIGYRPQGN